MKKEHRSINYMPFVIATSVIFILGILLLGIGVYNGVKYGENSVITKEGTISLISEGQSSSSSYYKIYFKEGGTYLCVNHNDIEKESLSKDKVIRYSYSTSPLSVPAQEVVNNAGIAFKLEIKDGEDYKLVFDKISPGLTFANVTYIVGPVISGVVLPFMVYFIRKGYKERYAFREDPKDL